MLERIHFSKILTIIGLASLLNLSSVSFLRSVRAESSQQNNGQNQRAGLPGKRVGAGSRRGYCDFDPKKVTALIPDTFLGVTATASPTLLFYVPEIAQQKKVEFVLRDPKDGLIYEKTLTATGKAGIISIKLPASAESELLKINQYYHWYFSIICDPGDRSKDVVLHAWIQRVEADPILARELTQATPIEKVKLYQEANLWHETLNTLVELKRSRPKDPTVLDMWIQLLQSVSLNETLAQEPLIDSSFRIGANGQIIAFHEQLPWQLQW